MRHALFTSVLGMTAGIAGAALFARLQPAPATPTPKLHPEERRHSSDGPHPGGAVVPAGWDPRFLARLSQVEGELAEVKSAVAPSFNQPEPRDKSEFEQERLRSYQRDLDHQAQKLNEHASEARDDTWAAAQAAEFTQALAPLVVPGVSSLKDVDCRSKSCVVQMTYASPAKALERRGDWIAQPQVKGCRGYSSALEPPTSDGPYDMVFVYNCR
jgi:hypothetical protein